jgi:hypothetical protein
MDLGFVSLTAFTVVTCGMISWFGYKISRVMVHSAEIASRTQTVTFAYAVILIAGTRRTPIFCGAALSK